MTSVKVKFRPSAPEGKSGSVYYRIIHARMVRSITTDIKISSDAWDDAASMPCLVEHRETVLADISRIHRIIASFEASGLTFSADDIVWRYRCARSTASLSVYMARIIDSLKAAGRLRTAETYGSTLRSFTTFRAETGASLDILLDAFSPTVAEAYQDWMRRRGLVPNTTSFYLRILRAVYRRAVAEGITDDKNPFNCVYTGIDDTVKRALTLPQLRRLCHLDLAATPALDFARDMFMMSFYLRGMSFIDMACLRKTDLCAGRITYRRRKTGRLLSIRWTAEMQALVDKYPASESPFLLPLVSPGSTSVYASYRRTASRINARLHTIAGRMHLPLHLTMYVARHSWASVAYRKGVAMSVISEGMGHSSEATTRIYLASLDTATIDRANSLIIRSL